MLTLVTDPAISLRLIQQRRDAGIDQFDEVWEGMYVMAPAPNDELGCECGAHGLTEVDVL